MKIVKDKYDNKYYLYLSEDCFLHIYNDWAQIFGKWNWISMNFVHIYFEKDIMTGCYEFEFIILGLGFRCSYKYTYDTELDKRLK